MSGARLWLWASMLMNASIVLTVPALWAWSGDVVLAGFSAACQAALGSTLACIYAKWSLDTDPSG
jgi:hypothetical protein